MNWDLVGCANPGCDRTAEQIPLYYTMNPTGGLIVHLKIRCVDGHTTYTQQAGTDGQETSSTGPLAG